jgi:hypothetical protein
MRFREFKLTEATASFAVTVPQGNRGADVADFQKALVALGYQLPVHGVDGIRGPETATATRNFQKDNQLSPSGNPDNQTVTAINASLAANPEAAKGLTHSTAADVKPGRNSGASVDVSAIQDPDFTAKLEKIATALGVKSSDLIAIMKQESRINPQAVNKMSNATGLIQFMPSTARSLGTSVEALYNMSAVEQLDYVYKYFKSVGVTPGMDVGDLYMAVFMPKYVGADDSTVLGQAGAEGFSGKVYDQNKGLDKNKDGAITVADVKQAVQRFA